MNKIVVFVILVLAVFGFIQLCWVWWFLSLRNKKVSSGNRPATLFDVRRLIVEGNKDSAVNMYKDIFGTTTYEAKKAVDDLARSIQKKNL